MGMGKSRRVAAVALIAVLSVGIAGCQPATGQTAATETEIALPPLSEIEPLEDPLEYEGLTHAVVGGPSVEPLEEAPEVSLPTTVTSYDGTGETEVTITDSSRIVPLSLTGSVGELVYAFGMAERIVGRDISTNFAGADDIPLVTEGGHSIDAESVLALNPTLIITDGSIGPTDVILQMRDAGVAVVTVERAVDSETGYLTAQQVADAMGVGSAAPELIEQLRQAVEAKEAEIKELLPEDSSKLPRVVFLYVRGNAGIYYLFGEGSGADSLIESVGAVDAAAEIDWVGERPMTEEALIAMDPDIIVLMTKGLESAGGVEGLLEAQPSIALTAAGQRERFITVDDEVLFAGGIRTPDVIDALARAIYAPNSL